MEKKEYKHYIDGNRIKYDFEGIEKGTIVGVELVGAFNIIPLLPIENKKLNAYYYLNSKNPFEYCFLNNDDSTIIIMEVIDEHTGRDVITNKRYLVGDENTELYIIRELQEKNTSEDLEIDLYKNVEEQPFVLSPMSIIKIEDNNTKKYILENYDIDKFDETIENLNNYSKEAFLLKTNELKKTINDKIDCLHKEEAKLRKYLQFYDNVSEKNKVKEKIKETK